MQDAATKGIKIKKNATIDHTNVGGFPALVANLPSQVHAASGFARMLHNNDDFSLGMSFPKIAKRICRVV